MKVGQLVRHHSLGRGEVVASRIIAAKNQALINFGYTRLWMNEESLEVLLSEPNTKATEQVQRGEHQVALAREPGRRGEGIDEPPIARPPELVSSEMEARRGVAALRLGQILEEQALALTVGTSQVEQRLKDALGRVVSGMPAFVLVDGAWGGGKTHALTLLQALARQEQMATGGAVLDGISRTLADPTALVGSVLASLRISGATSHDGLGQLLRLSREEARLARIRVRGARDLAEALARIPSEMFDDPDAMQVIEDYFSLAASTAQFRAQLIQLGCRVAMPVALRPTRAAGRPEAMAGLLRNWSQMLFVMGARGFVVVFDELDVEYASTAYANASARTAKARRRSFLEALASLGSGSAPLLVAFASAPAGAEVERENDAVEDVRHAFGKHLFHIKAATLDEADLVALLNRVVSLYQGAYPRKALGLSGERLSTLFGRLYDKYRRNPTAVPRHFVRMVLEVCDLLTIGNVEFKDVIKKLQAPY